MCHWRHFLTSNKELTEGRVSHCGQLSHSLESRLPSSSILEVVENCTLRSIGSRNCSGNVLSTCAEPCVCPVVSVLSLSTLPIDVFTSLLSASKYVRPVWPVISQVKLFCATVRFGNYTSCFEATNLVVVVKPVYVSLAVQALHLTLRGLPL